ncbi:MAG TPA: adenine deaminase [Baekduia sp.]|uniref:adenine deaminase n=1 Tax=Baekduia sp. TaxID=2600305 RepID=UPI002D76F48A|nr:adenine deaminase [Baekduia sp.]HET6510149.1 adenine deaminase [Baekduia sp.]
MTDVLAHAVRVARGAEPADLVVRGGRVVDVLSQRVTEPCDVAVVGERIVALGHDLRGRETVEARGAYVAPGFIDAHVHIESSLVAPGRFAEAVLPHGTTTIVSDPHEIANVLGVAGIEWMLAASSGLDLSVLMMAPACVPASPLETAGARLTAADLIGLADRHARVLGLAEMMNYPGVLAADPDELAKLVAFAGRPIDGHAPGVVATDLQAYLAAGVASDHECLTADEAREKVAHGMTVFLREATNARNLLDVLPAVTTANARRFAFCTDDRVPGELLDDGSIDAMVRMAVDAGLDPVTAITMATLNAAEHYNLRDRGAVAPGRRADLVLFDDLRAPRPDTVLAGGRVVARGGEHLGDQAPAPGGVGPTMDVAWRDTLELARAGDRVKAIGLIADQLVTTAEPRDLASGAGAGGAANGIAAPQPDEDLLRLSVVERHRATGNVGHGFVTGFGLRAGALASSVAHDSHNIVTVAADDRDAMVAARAVADLGGGLVVAAGGEVRATVPLEIAGLMADRSPHAVAAEVQRAETAARDLGCRVGAPFMALSFLALPVIPSLKLTDHGLVDVDAFALTDVFI